MVVVVVVVVASVPVAVTREVVLASDARYVAKAGVVFEMVALTEAKLCEAAAESVARTLTVEVTVVMDDVTVEPDQ